MTSSGGPRPVLAVVRSKPSGDGVGYVGLLLQYALRDLYGKEPRLVALDAGASATVSLSDGLRFIARLTAAQLTRPPAPPIFNHIGIARAQRRVPRVFRRPYAVFLHGIEVWDPALDAERLNVIRDATVRLSNSFYSAHRVTAVHGGLGRIVPCPLALLPDAIGPSDADRVAARAIVGKAAPSVAIIGRMSLAERYKGHDELLEAWPLVRRRYAGAQLIVVGRGDDLERLRQKAAELGVSDAVTFTGFLEDGIMRAVLAECDVYAMPSRGEGFGLAYLEAMRAGLPCIGSRSDAAVDVIEHEQTGMLVAAEDSSALASAILRLFDDKNLRSRMGKAGQQREREVFTFANFRDRVGAALSGAN